jgi:hypothetical protein
VLFVDVEVQAVRIPNSVEKAPVLMRRLAHIAPNYVLIASQTAGEQSVRLCHSRLALTIGD